ncbi:nesprin-2-like isoform X3 [Odontesthes bonariensis]|uniref:nesprin-2-like isoform X3 n=1 Tax=Odontesthes bonariensis TaxID=219752 RepID=UPI003F5830D7
MQDQPEEETVVERDPTTSTAAVLTWPHGAGTEMIEIPPSEDETMKLSGSVDQVNLSEQEKLEEFKDHDDQAKEIQVSTHGIQDSPESQDKRPIQKGPEIRILQLDIPFNLEDIENTLVTLGNEPGADIIETTIHSESVLESSAEFQNNLAQTDSAQPNPPESIAQSQHETEFIEISFYEQDMVKPVQTELLQDAEEKPKVVREHSIQDEHPNLLTHGRDSAPTSFDEEPVTERIHIGPEVRILQLDKQTSSEENKNTCIAIEQEPRIDFVQTGNHTEREKEEMTVDVIPGNAATEMTKIATQEDSTEHKDTLAQRESDQLTSLVYESIQPHEIRYIELNLHEQDIVSTSQTETETEFLKTTQQIPGKEQGTLESHPETSAHGADGGSRSLEEKSVVEEKIPMESEVLVLQVDIPASMKEGENTLIIVAKEVPENQDETTADLQPEKADTKTRQEGQQIGSERQEDVAQNDSDQNMSGVFTEETFEEISLSEQDTDNTIYKEDKVANLQSSKLEQQITIEKVPKTDGDETTIQCKKVAEIQALANPDAQPEKTTLETSIVVNIEEHGHQETLEIGSTGLINDEPSENDTQLNSNKVARERLEVESDADVQPTRSAPSTTDMLDAPKTFDEKSVEKSEIQMTPLEEMTKVDVHESFTDSLSEPCVVPKVKMEELAVDATDKNDGQQQEKKTEREGEEKETFVSVEPSLQMEQELVLSAGKMSTESLQTVEKLSTDIVLGDVIHLEGLSASVLKTEKLVMEPTEVSAMDKIFTEIQELAGTGAISQLIEAKSQEDAPEAFITTISDTRLSRVVSKVLSLKNCPAELSPTAMARQVEEVQEYRGLAQLQVSLFSQLKEAGAENGDSLEHLVDQWKTAAQDGAAVIQSKEAQLELVTDYCRQIQTVKSTMDKLTTELDGVKSSPLENSHKEAERLCSLQRSIEENRTVIGELLVTHTKLCLHLNWSDREAAQTELKNLQERWRALERNIESNLHHTKVHSHQTSSLLSELSCLQEHMEKIRKDLETTFSSVGQWNCKVAQQLMQANAEVKAAQQRCQHFQQLSEELLLSSRWEIQSKEIHQWLQEIKDKLCHTEEQVSSQSKNSSNPIMEKIIAVMRDGLAWAKQTESDIEGRRKRVPLLPEEVYRQLQDLKKLQAEVMAKQGQLESLVEEVTELLPQLDQAEEVPIVHSSLECLEELSKSTTEKLSKTMKEIESGLQTREKLFEQIADLDSWIVAHLQSVAFRSEDSELMSHNELDRRVRQIQETLAEAERQAAICEALLMNSKDIASELSVTQTCQLFDKIRNLQEDIKAISTNEKANKEELEELVKTIDSRNKNLVAIEKSLRQILVDLSRHRYPITRESLQYLEPFKLMILEHKSQVDLLVPWIPHEKACELNLVITELQNKILTLEMKAKDHERYLNTRQYVEDLKEIIQKQVHQTKENSRDLEERYKMCHTLLIQFPLMKELCKDAQSILQRISAELYPSQLTVEQQRLRQNEESFDTLEMTLSNNLRLIEWDVLKILDLESEKKAIQPFLLRTQQELQKPLLLEPNETLIDREYQRIVSLKKIVESKTRVLEVLEQKKGNKDRQRSQVLMALKNAVLSECDSQMETICQARECLRGYTCTVKEAVRFLRDIEGSILPPQGSAGPCRESLEESQQALVSLQHQFQIYVEQLQNHFALQTYLSPQKLEQLQQNILSQLLVRVSTLQAKGHVRLECLSRCVEQHTNYNKSHDEIIQSLKSAENRLLEVTSQKVTCLAECTDQKEKLRALTEETDSLLRQLEELREWCPEQSCRGGREAAVTAIWRWVSRLHRCTQKLTTRSKQKIAEWLDITNSVEKASVVLEQVEAELPDGPGLKASTEELQDLLQSWEQYQDRLDCEHRALSALELRTARLLGVPAHLEQAPPTPLCQQLQVMQGRYDSVTQKSREGLLAGRLELEDREKHREELQVVCVWLEAADSLLSDMEQCSSTQELQEIYSQLFVQKALLQRIMESLKMKYSDMYTLVPVEIDSQLQEVTKSLEQVEVKVGEAVERSGPVHRLGAKLSDIQAGLGSVQRTLEERSPTVPEAKFTQKRVWDVLDKWHSRLAALEVDMQDLEKPEEALVLTERLVEVQQLHSLLSKQAEQRTTLLSKIHTWLQEHQEMIKSSKSWMAEAQSWLTAPCTYTTAKCLSSHVNALQLVLDDAAQIRTTLQGFSSVLKEMSQVCDITALQEQLNEADRQVADVQDSFTAPLSQLEHAAAEVEAIESEVKWMEDDVAEIKALLSSPDAFPSPKEDSLKMIEQRIQSMRRTIAEIQKCKPGLCLPEKAEETLTVFNVVELLQTLLMELEKKVPALFIQQPSTPVQAKVSAKLQTSTSEVAEEEEQGQIRVVHLEVDILKRSGGTLQTVEPSSPEQRQSRRLHDTQQQEHQGVLQAEEATENKRNEEPRVEDIGGRVLWWLWDAFLGASPEVPAVVVSEKAEAAAGQSTETAAEDKKDVEGSSDTAEASSPEALSKPVGTVRTQSLPESMGSQPGPSSHECVLHECLERVSQLELWLLKAQRSLQAAGAPCSSTMQDSVEQQLLTCQEMFLEIEEKVASLSALSPAVDQQQLSELGAVGPQQEAAELLASKLEHLKANLVSFQQLLQDRHGEDKRISSRDTPEQTLTKPLPPAERQPESKLKRSGSVQEIFSSPRNKLLRQSSLQQQKELEHELTEQRGLTQAIARQGSRVRLYSQEPEDQSQLSPRPPPAEADVEEDSTQKKWDRLHSRLLALEESRLLPPSEVTDSSKKGSDGTAGCIIGAKNLKELQTYISYLRELGHTSAELLNQASPVEDSHQVLDEGLFNVLHGASQSLSSISNLLLSPAERTHEEDTQLKLLHMQSLSAELVTLGSELVSQGAKISHLLGSECVRQCVEDLSRVLPVVQAALSSRETELQNLHEATAEKQACVQMQESPQQQVEPVISLLEEANQCNLPAFFIHKATQLQDELDTVLGGVRSHCGEQKSRVDLQQVFEQLVHSLKELLSLGSERLAQQPDMELHSKAQLQHRLSSHTKFFQFLGHHIHILQYLTNTVPDIARQRWEGVLMSLQDEVVQLQQRGLEKGIRMQETLQMWSQWEEDSIWSDSQLKIIETTFPNMQQRVDSEQQISKNISVYKELHCILEDNRARFSQMLESGRRLQRVGCSAVGVSTLKLEARWESLHKRLEHERTTFDRRRKLRSRFLRDSAALADWMTRARESADKWSRITVSAGETMDVQQRHDLFFQSVALTKELEAKSELRLTLIGTATQLVKLREEEGDSYRHNEDQGTTLSQTSDSDLGSFNSQLKQIELDWSSLLADMSVIQQALHKTWMEGFTQQVALLELQAWLSEAETQLEEHRSSINQNFCTNTVLTRVLKYCKECQIEKSAHQATLDYVNQPLQTCSTEDDQRGRYEYNQYAEEEGRLNDRWLYFQKNLDAQIQEVEQELRDRAELDARLQQINSWITDQNLWIDSVQTPSSLTELQNSISVCQDLEEKIGQKCAVLRELKDKICGKREKSRCDYISHTDESIQACAALTENNESVKKRLIQAQQLWSSMEKKQNHMMLKTIRAAQTLDSYCSPQLSLQAHRHFHEKLQLLLEETQPCVAEWDELSQTTLSLSGIISPAAAAILTERLARQRDSWAEVVGALGRQLQKSQDILSVWCVYAQLAGSLSEQLQTLQRDITSELSVTPGRDNTVDWVNVKIHNVQSLFNRTDPLQSDLEELLEASKALVSHLETSAASLVQSESRLLSRGVLQLSQQLSGRLSQLQEELKQLQEFENVLESLERNLEVWQQRLENVAQTDQSGLLELSCLSADLDVLNELSCGLTLGEAAARRLQRLNHCWATASTRAEEACSELQTEALRQQTFEQKCESWMSFLQRMEDSLAVDVAGSYFGLRQQLCAHKRFQAELSLGHQILHSVITESLHLLQKGEVDDRSDFILKLAQLREHWQGAVQRTDQRRSLVEGLLKHWHLYSHSLRKLQRFLSDTQTLLPPAGPARCSLQQLRRSLQDLQHTELLFQRYQSTFIHTLEVGRQLFSMGNEETQTQLQMDLGTLQEEWDNLYSLLGRRMDLTEAIIKNWERCENGLANSMLQLKDMKTRLNQSMPDYETDLQSAKKFNKENEDSLEDWAESLTELSTMKTDLSQYIIADDVLLLQEQVEHLHCQWEELCFKVSLRKQEITDRLNAWIIFNEKNKELCEWLTQMENKVAHNSDLNIEEMVEKLKKDCMEEINLFSENKTHLKQLGEQLITASNKTKETEINDKLKDVNDRWQHLFDHIEARVSKLKETLVTVQQLDKNMSNLRTWLSRIEAELAKPVVYNVCHSDEIQKKLAEQQDLQRNIEQHTESVASVLTLCDVLLHDADACSSENDSIQQTTRSLDRRWRNICAMSMERRMRIEETWRLWCKFLDDYSRFEDWLRAAELTAASPDSANVLYTSAKEELKKFEAFQRQVHERLTQLELVNKQYRRLARENRTDAASKLKVMVHDGNQRWDCLQRRVAAVLRRLKHFTSQREDFEGTREGILVWLTEMDLQLTNVEHFSESDIEDKMRQLNGFQQEITLNTNKIDALIVFGENLIQKSAPLDAVLIEDELEELHSYCQEVFGRVARFHHRLVNRRPVLEEEREMSDRDTDMDDTPDLTSGTSWTEVKRKKEENEVPAGGGVSAGRHAMCQLLVPPPERSGRETPVSVDSIPLEWDHTVDVGGTSSHEDDEEATFFSALSVKSVTDTPSWHQPGSPDRKRVPRDIILGLSSLPMHTAITHFHQQGYAKLMSECSGSINSVKRVKLILNDDEELEDAGLTSSTANKQIGTGVIERWELLQAQKCADVSDIKEGLEQWQKLNSDLCDVTSWLGRVLPELERLQRIAPSTSIRDIEVNIKKLKEMQRIFNSYKCLMISVNLSCRHYLRGDSVELRELQEALNSANHSWTEACSSLESWERTLHSALMQCQEFHEMLHSLLMWLSQAESKLRAVNVEDQSASPSALLKHQDTLMALQEELRGRHHQVSVLQEISFQLLLEASGEESVEAKEKVHVIGNKLHLLLRQVAAALRSLQERLEGCLKSSQLDSIGLGTLSSPPLHKEEAPSQAVTVGQPAARREERRDPSPPRPFLYRVLRAAFPLHLLVFMLLVLVCLVPLSDEDYSCTLSNNFARSFYPMLHYTNGPPPT